MDCFASLAMTESLSIPSAGPEPFLQMSRRGGRHAYRVLVPRNRDHDLAGMQMQARLAEARSVAIDIVADNRPAHGGGVNAQLMGAAGDRFQREPGEAIAAPQYFPVGDRGLAVGIGLLPPAALGIEAAERHVDHALVLDRAAFDHRPISLGNPAMFEQQAQRRRRLAMASQHET